MWWVIHMCRGFDPLFSLWQDRARSFWGIFSHPPTPKRSFVVLKLPILTEFDLLGPKFHFSLDLFGSNFQRPAAHPHHFSDRVPSPGSVEGLMSRDGVETQSWCESIVKWTSLDMKYCSMCVFRESLTACVCASVWFIVWGPLPQTLGAVIITSTSSKALVPSHPSMTFQVAALGSVLEVKVALNRQLPRGNSGCLPP